MMATFLTTSGGSVDELLTGSRVEPTVASGARRTAGKTEVYVLDTSVLLADHRSLHRFAEHEVVLPLAVIAELEGKRNHPELGWSARQSLRTLELLRTEHGSLTAPFR